MSTPSPADAVPGRPDRKAGRSTFDVPILVLLAVAAVCLNLRLHSLPGIPVSEGLFLFEAGGRSALLPQVEAGFVTYLAGWMLLYFAIPRRRRPPALIYALIFLALAGTALERTARGLQVETRPSPYLIWELNPHASRHNRWGMLYPDFPPRHEPGEFRFLVLGDSSAWGYSAGPGSPRFSDLLEQRVQAAWPGRTVRVLNAAVPGYTTFQMAGALERKYLALQPDCLVLATNSDWSLERAPDRDRLPPAWQRPLLAVLDASELYLCLAGAFRDPPHEPPSGAPVPRVPAPESRTNLEAMIASVKARGGSAIVVNMPLDLERHDPDLGVQFRVEDLRAWREQAQAAAAASGSVFLDLDAEWHQRFGRNLDPLFIDFVHPAARGHEEIARRLFEVVQAGRTGLGRPAGAPAGPGGLTP